MIFILFIPSHRTSPSPAQLTRKWMLSDQPLLLAPIRAGWGSRPPSRTAVPGSDPLGLASAHGQSCRTLRHLGQTIQGRGWFDVRLHPTQALGRTVR